MHQPPQGESIWGTINTCMEIALDIYMIIAKDADGIEHSGVIMANKETAEKNLSSKAISMAKKDGDWLCYDEHTKDIPLLEVLQHRMEACKQSEMAISKQIEDIKQNGKVFLPDYFGECTPPIETSQGKLKDTFPVRNGIYFSQDNQDMFFAVNKAIADIYMTPMAVGFGQKYGEYLFYDLASSAIPLNELKNVFQEVESLIVSEDSLYATLNHRFRAYVSQYNDGVLEESKIPEVNAPDSLFLAMQLETAKGITEEMSQGNTFEPDFNEEVGYEI